MGRGRGMGGGRPSSHPLSFPQNISSPPPLEPSTPLSFPHNISTPHPLAQTPLHFPAKHFPSLAHPLKFPCCHWDSEMSIIPSVRLEASSSKCTGPTAAGVCCPLLPLPFALPSGDSGAV